MSEITKLDMSKLREARQEFWGEVKLPPDSSAAPPPRKELKCCRACKHYIPAGATPEEVVADSNVKTFPLFLHGQMPTIKIIYAEAVCNKWGDMINGLPISCRDARRLEHLCGLDARTFEKAPLKPVEEPVKPVARPATIFRVWILYLVAVLLIVVLIVVFYLHEGN